MCGCGNKIRRVNTMNSLYKKSTSGKRLNNRTSNYIKNKTKIKKLFI